jgi:hypothetical protein
MTESEWLRSDDPTDMLRALSDVGMSKLRLFGVACCRRVAHKLPYERIRRVLDVCERYANGSANADELAQAQATALAVPLLGHYSDNIVVRQAVAAVTHLTGADRHFHWRTVEEVRSKAARAADDGIAERRWQCELLRCLFGARFHSGKMPPACLEWGRGLAVEMARMIAQERRWQDMPVLADVLEDAGCSSELILAHCRSGQEHVDGCWVLETLLARS